MFRMRVHYLKVRKLCVLPIKINASDRSAFPCSRLYYCGATGPQLVAQAHCLRLVLSANGIMECSLKNRIQMSHASLGTLRNAKLIFPRADPSYAKMVYRTFRNKSAAIADPHLLLMFNIDTLGLRRRTLADDFVTRLMSIVGDDNATERKKLQAKKTQIALNSPEAFQRIVPLGTKQLRKDQTMPMSKLCAK